ncbi:MAG: DUF1697 domain-containing protein [Deltaproteobacteria bacterium]|jgi:uncharacterized protein (DUF1697 family)|nr:DUF1697 domain-containing protein [Deltaproteobacteria bacterium]
MARYVALLRGINVGGKNVIKMVDLQRSFEGLGLDDVHTYIQSGNVVFSSKERSATALVEPIASMLAATFDYAATLTVLSRAQMKRTVDGAPAGFGSEPKAYRYDVMFLLPPLTANKAMAEIPTKTGVDAKFEGKGVVYFTRLIAKASSSGLSRIVGLPIYQQMTIRNWNTTTKLLELLTRKR